MTHRPDGKSAKHKLPNVGVSPEGARGDASGHLVQRVDGASTASSERGLPFARAVDALLASANADQLAELVARANNALPDDDQRKIRGEDVHMLRRLAGQARTFSSSLIDHAAERRLVGERRGRVSPESGDTADWAERLATALETAVSPSTTSRRARR